MFPNLKAEMARRDLNIHDLADLVFVSYTTMWAWLNDRRAISLNMAIKIRDALGLEMSVEELFRK